jgi:hypothetical protein
MRVFLAACLAIVIIGTGGYFFLNAMQQPAGVAYSSTEARIPPGWSWRSVLSGAVVGDPTSNQCTARTAPQWIFVDLRDPNGEPSICSISQ